MAENKINVPIEKVVHDALKEVAQNVMDEYNIRINSINFGWVDISTHQKRRFIVDYTNANTTVID